MTMRPSGSSATACSMRLPSLQIWATRLSSVKTSARTIFTLGVGLGLRSACGELERTAAGRADRRWRVDRNTGSGQKRKPCTSSGWADSFPASGSESRKSQAIGLAMSANKPSRARQRPAADWRARPFLWPRDRHGRASARRGLDNIRLQFSRWPWSRHIGKDIGIAGIALGCDGAIAGPTRLDNVGWIGVTMKLFSTSVSTRKAGSVARWRSASRRAGSVAQTGNEIVEAISIVGDGEAMEPSSRSSTQTASTRTTEIETDENGHGCTFATGVWYPVPGRPARCRGINRRSGRIFAEVPWRHLPVAVLVRPPQRRKSHAGPARGERTWRALRHGGAGPTPPSPLN